MSHEVLGNVMFFVIMFTWIMYVCQEMFISGASALNLSLSSNEKERKQIQVTSGLHFDGMEVWLITAIALTFGVFPEVFALVLSQLYVVFFVLLYVIIARGVSIEVIYKIDDPKWQKVMAYVWMISSILLMFLLGVYLTNMFYGFPYEFGFTKGFLSAINTTTISGGLLFVAMSFVAGSSWIYMTVLGDLKSKATRFVKRVGVIYMIPIFVLLVFMGLNNSNSSIFVGELFTKYPVLFVLPAMTVVSAILVTWYGYIEEVNKMFLFTILTMVFFLVTGFVGSFPSVLVSHTSPAYSLHIVDVMSSKNSMMVSFVAVCIFYPLVIGYQTWKYIRFARNINLNDE